MTNNEPEKKTVEKVHLVEVQPIKPSLLFFLWFPLTTLATKATWFQVKKISNTFRKKIPPPP
ncbi:MAG: hypothetical protein HQM14_20370 [SAR324 cluster bacterium]|nr:hypothetical protein [SAR324 cluster bacterium]